MSYNQRLINDRPAYFYPLREGTLAFHDSMGSGPAALNGNPVLCPPLVVGGGAAYVMNGNDNLRFISRVFGANSVQTPFTLEAWFKPVAVTTAKGIVGHANQADGLTFDGERISFATMHGPAGTASAVYFPNYTTAAFHVVGVHTGSKNELYVNGDRVASVELTEAQIQTPYQISTASEFLYIGHLSGSIIVDSVAVYSEALPTETITRHFRWGRDTPDFKDVVSGRGGNYWSFTDATARPIFDFKFDTEAEWATGESTSVSVDTDTLTPAFDETGKTREGNWQAGFILGAIADTLDGSRIEWDSDGAVTVQTSISGGAFTNAVSGREVSGLGQGFNARDQSLIVRVLFPGGEPADTISRLRSLSIKLYESRSSSADVSGLNANFNGNFSLADYEHQPIEQEDRSGVNMYSANASIKADSARTIELWVMLNESAGPDEYIFDARPSTNAYLRYSGSQWSTSTGTILYVNGVERTGAAISILPGRWTHIMAVLPSPTSDNILIGDRNLSLRVGMYANYNYTMTSTQVQEVFNAYLGITFATFNENTGLRIVDSEAAGVRIYSYAWTLTSSG